MSLYEHVFIARQDVSPQRVEELTRTYGDLIREGGGSVGRTEYWGLRTLAYRIKKNRKGHYALMDIDAPHAAVSEMERQMRLNDEVIRFLTLRVEAHEEGPSAMMVNKHAARGRSTDNDDGDSTDDKSDDRRDDSGRPARRESRESRDSSRESPKPDEDGPDEDAPDEESSS